jgi:hydrogenase expression/formation protein HypD
LKYIEEFRNLGLAQALGARIAMTSTKALGLMEVCGSHTVSIFRHGIRNLLPSTIRLLSGPGCPVCVTAARDIDRAIALARTPRVIFSTFGDMLRVPGSYGSLQDARAQGADVRIVYSPLDALDFAKEEADRQVVFFGVGFETTSPLIAATLKRAISEGIRNFFVFSVHKLIPPALKALVSSREVQIDGFLLPGHVSAILGAGPYEFLAWEHHIPAVISGFEPLDILQSIWMLVRQAEKGEARVEIQYRRVVSAEGNSKALQCLREIFEPVDDSWRGLGMIPQSGLKLRQEWREWDAEANFELPAGSTEDDPRCRCGKVLRGALLPSECPLFGTICSPENPLGPCMVSSEGTCSTYFRYGARA